MESSGSPLVALVVDDEFLIAVELEAILTAGGYHVLTAANVPEARNLADLRSIDVAVLNFRMGAGAIEFAQALQTRGVPTLFCTGSSPTEVHALFPSALVLAKPFSSDQLLALLKGAIGR